MLKMHTAYIHRGEILTGQTSGGARGAPNTKASSSP